MCIVLQLFDLMLVPKNLSAHTSVLVWNQLVCPFFGTSFPPHTRCRHMTLGGLEVVVHTCSKYYCRHFWFSSGQLGGRTISTQSLFERHCLVSHVVTAHRSVTSLPLHIKTASQSTAVQSAFRNLGHSASKHGLQSPDPDPDPDCPFTEARIDNKKIEAQVFERSIFACSQLNFFLC